MIRTGLILCFVSILFLPQHIVAQEQTKVRADVMILGSYHMHNPGADVFNVKADDVLAPHRQEELSAIITKLTRFNPTMLALEIPRGTSRDTLEQNNYQDFIDNDFTLTRWEGHQIGFKIAKSLNHSQVYNIDESGDFPFNAMVEYANKNGQSNWVDSKLAEMKERTNQEESESRNKTIGEMLEGMNEPKAIERSHGIYIESCQIGLDGDFPGANLLSKWYERNAKIFSNLYKITEGKSKEKILVIIGAGHAHILRELIRLSPDFDLIEPNDYLKTRTPESYLKVLKDHLRSVEEKNLMDLKKTLDIEGNYHLILPDGSQMTKAQDFIGMHEDWFKQDDWKIEMDILHSEEYGEIATAFVQADYREPDRNGKPYHHKMWITYILKKQDGKWHVIHDHCSTATKSN